MDVTHHCHFVVNVLAMEGKNSSSQMHTQYHAYNMSSALTKKKEQKRVRPKLLPSLSKGPKASDTLDSLQHDVPNVTLGSGGSASC